MTFDKFLNRVVIDAKLVATTPIFVGAGADSFKPGSINGSCIKDVYGRPYIPGSSLKGVLRAFLSSALSIPDDPDESIVNKKFEGKEERIFKDKERQEEYASPLELANAIIDESTDVETLFGSRVMAGKVKIADAVPYEEFVDTEVRNGVAIDRDTHTAVAGALFDTEVVPSGTAFRFSASAENLSGKEAALFGRLMEYFAKGNISVGGRSRAGLGSVELCEVMVTIYRAVPGDFPEQKKIDCSEIGIREAIVSVCETDE